MPDFVIYSTSNTYYQSWQCDLLEYSYVNAHQKGELIALCSEGENGDLSPRESNIAMVIPLPSYMKNQHTGDFWGIANKLGSLKSWIDNQEVEGSVLFLDPDMVFIKPIDLHVKEGKVIAQRWVDSGIAGHPIFDKYCRKNRHRITKETIFMYPYLMHTADIRKTMERYYELSHEIRDVEKKWESDMYALVIVAAEFALDVETVDDMGVCNNWEEHNNLDTPIVHFPVPFLNPEGQKIWFKQDFTQQAIKKPWTNLPAPSEAKSRAEYSVLALIQNLINKQEIEASGSDYLYWQNMPKSLLKYQPNNTKYIVFDQYPGGFNNIRMSLELAAVFALLLNRVLVLPPRTNYYLLEGECGFEDFFDISALGIEVIEFEDYCERNNIEINSLDQAWKDVAAISYVADWDVIKDLVKIPENIKACEYFENYKMGRESLFFDTETLTSDHILFPKNLLGNFYLTIFAENRLKEMTQFVASHIHYKDDILLEAYNIIKVLGDQNYAAIHIRRNDFQYKDLFIDGEQILRNISPILKAGETLYIATDAQDHSFLKPLEDVYKVVYFSDVQNRINQYIDSKLIGSIEQLVCTRARVFIGTRLSTFSSYIYRMRGYMDDIYDTNFYDNTLECKLACHQTPVTKFPTWTDAWQMTWGREFPEAWNFKEEVIFISIASYRDPDIENTITDLLENADNQSLLVVGVCLQDNTKKIESFSYKNHKRIKVLSIPFEDARGACYARSLIQEKLYDGEKYYLQVDSHSRFAKGWDTYLKANLLSCKSPRPILTTYPNGFSADDKNRSFLKNNKSSLIAIEHFNEAGFLKVRGKQTVSGAVPAPSIWLAAGFVFTFGNWVKDVPYNAQQYFNGEEDSLLIRSYTNGWDTFVPPKNVVFHDYNDNRMQSKTKVRPLHWEDHQNIKNNFDILHGLHLGKGVGTVRSIVDFQERHGVNFETKEVRPWAKEGLPKELAMEEITPGRHHNQYDVYLETDEISIRKYKIWIFCLFDSQGTEIYRKDIIDELVLNKKENWVKVSLDLNSMIYPIVKALIWPVMEDNKFASRHEYPVKIDRASKTIVRSDKAVTVQNVLEDNHVIVAPIARLRSALQMYDATLNTKTIDDSYALWILCFFDHEGKEVYRKDIDDKEIIEKRTDSLLISIDRAIDPSTLKTALIWPMTEEKTFASRIEYEIEVDLSNKTIKPSPWA